MITKLPHKVWSTWRKITLEITNTTLEVWFHCILTQPLVGPTELIFYSCTHDFLKLSQIAQLLVWQFVILGKIEGYRCYMQDKILGLFVIFGNIEGHNCKNT